MVMDALGWCQMVQKNKYFPDMVAYTVAYKTRRNLIKTRVSGCVTTLPLNNLNIFEEYFKALEIRLKALILGAFLYVWKEPENDVNLCKMLSVVYKWVYWAT